MKDIKLFVLGGCPYCIKALDFQNQLIASRPEYAALSIEIIDEQLQKEVADSFDYYYVPTYYVDGKKVHEGAIDKDGVAAVLKSALE